MRFLALFFAMVFHQAIVAQVPLPDVFRISSDTSEWEILPDSCWQILADKNGDLSIDQVSAHSSKLAFQKGIQNIDSLTNTYWVRYRVLNNLSKEFHFSIDSEWDFSEVFIFDSTNSYKKLIGGTHLEWSKKQGLKYINLIPDTLQPGEQHFIYLRLKGKYPGIPKTFEILIFNTEKAINDYYVQYVEGRTNYFNKRTLQESFLIGILFLAVFISLIFYRIVGESVYLSFALFAFFLALNRFYNIFDLYCRWEYPQWTHLVPVLGFLWGIIPFFQIQFYRQYLNIKLDYPRWDKFLWILGVVNFVIPFLNFVNSYIFIDSIKYFNLIDGSIFSFFIIPIAIVITLLILFKRRDKSVRIVILASFPFLLLYILFFFKTGYLAKYFMNYFRLFEVFCLGWMVVAFTWILLSRFEKLKKENLKHELDKERLAKEKEMEKAELIEKQNALLELKVKERTTELATSLNQLKLTQSQLVQSEKLASLGELTAGIAHEIQNPLNFVNNFSEVSIELMDELIQEMQDGNFAEISSISTDVKQNLEKINYHGKRADSIVKGMLQHSRSSNGLKELTDINALADEYLRLAYHGLRAKDKSFNAGMKTNLDPSLSADENGNGKINIVSQDIGRVILNLITNAFYVVDQKKRNAQTGYDPMVVVSTKRKNESVEISVKDNGTGIPQKVLDKIFQPFFTTKPTGQGTGLGLSLSYDIVKAHGGDLKVETKEGEGSEFIISLPVV